MSPDKRQKAGKVRDSETAPPYPDPKAMSLVPVERIERCILLLRGHKVMLDDDLAELYAVPVKVLNQAVKRNLSRFPADFMFQLTADEVRNMRSQIVTASRRNVRFPKPLEAERGGIREIPENIRNSEMCLIGAW